MMKRVFGFLIAMLLVGGNVANAIPTDLVTQGDNWNYKVLGTDLWSSWGTVGYDASYFTGLTSNGNAAFGNSMLPYNTYWAANTDLALQKNIVLNGAINGDLTLNVASDNGFLVFINNQQVAKQNAEGFTSYWEYTFNISNSFLVPGANVISVLAEDHGGATWFDMRLSADVVPNPVPEPGTWLLLGGGLIGLAAFRKRFARK